MPLSTIFGLTATSLTFLTIFLVGFIKNEQLQDQRAEQNQQYICDAYAYDIESAPEFCKKSFYEVGTDGFPDRSTNSACDLDDVPEDECKL